MKRIIQTILTLLLCASGAYASVARLELPADVMLDKDAVAQGLLTVPLRLESGEEILFIVDTGSPLTCFDQSLKKRLGKRLRLFELSAWEVRQKAGMYAAPKLYLGGTPLMTGSNVLTCDFKKFSSDFGRPVKGILGMDCLQHYCIQLDFGAGVMRFLSPSTNQVEYPGTRFPLTFSNVRQDVPEYFRPFIQHEALLADKGANLLVDTGLDVDGGLAPELVREKTADPNGSSFEQIDKAQWYVPECTWGGNTYTNLLVIEAPETVAGKGASVVGLRFLSRHLVTFDFPNRTMYLQPQAVGPLFSDGDLLVASLLPTDGNLPRDINDRVTAFLDRKRLSFWFRNFGGTMSIKLHGDPTSFNYAIGRKSKNGFWKLKKAWSTDPKGNTIEKFAVPAE